MPLAVEAPGGTHKKWVAQAEQPAPLACTTAPGPSDIHGSHGAVPSSSEVLQEHVGASTVLVAKLEAFYMHFNKELCSRAADKVASFNGDPHTINTKLRARYGADLSFLDSIGNK